MHYGAAHDCASRSCLLVGLSWKTPREDLQPLRRKTMTRTKTEDLFIEAHHERELAMAQPHRSFGDGIKDRLDVRRRTRDYAENVCARSLQLPSLRELPLCLRKLVSHIGVEGVRHSERPEPLARGSSGVKREPTRHLGSAQWLFGLQGQAQCRHAASAHAATRGRRELGVPFVGATHCVARPSTAAHAETRARQCLAPTNLLRCSYSAARTTISGCPRA